jgi:tetratricopeptide (TPR) repeat protein
MSKLLLLSFLFLLQDEDRFIRSGKEKMAQGDWKGAIADFTEAIHLDPKNAMTYGHRADAYLWKGDLKEAVVDCNRGIELDPTLDWLYIVRGLAKHHQEEVQAAIEDYDRAIVINPSYGGAFESRGYGYYDLHSWKESLADFQQALTLGSSNDLYLLFRIWLIQTRTGRREEASQDLVRGMRNVSVDDWAKTLSEFLLGERKEEGFLSKALTNEQKCEAFFYAGTLHSIAGHEEQASALFTKCLETGVRTFTEYRSASAELNLLRKKR